MSEFHKMLIVGFDGLDYEKIQKYECENLQLEDFGKLDLEGMPLRTTSLWASLITGKKPEEHGVDSMLTFSGEKVRKVDKYVSKFFNIFGMSAIHLRKCFYYYLFDSGVITMDRRFLKVPSIFEKVSDSRVLECPGYTEYPYIAGQMGVTKVYRERAPISRERAFRDMRAELNYRKKLLFEGIGEHKLLMQHFHYPDWFQHLFPKGKRDRELYEDMDELAGKILEKVDRDTLVVFCSDHGLEDGGHRDQAFYSVNIQVGENVSITNLVEECLAKLDYQEKEELTEEVEV